MRLSFQLTENTIVSQLEMGALSCKRVRPFAPERVERLSRELLGVLARAGRQAAGNSALGHLTELQTLGEQLAHLLVDPEIGARLPESDEPVYLQLDEHLVAIPWELLHDGHAFWCQRFDLGRAVATLQPQVSRRLSLAPKASRLRMLVIASDARGDLPHVKAEGQTLLAQLDQNSAIDADLMVDPSVEQVQRSLKDYEVVHFAGHAEHHHAAPERSGWILADGPFTAADVLALQGGRAMPLLVFSNACHSGKTVAWSGGSEIYGLANAFLLAGVQLYIGTQWEVVDAYGAELAHAFYRALDRGAAAGAAMRIARDEHRQHRGSLGWASYLLYGDPSVQPVRPTAFEGKPFTSANQLEARIPVKKRIAPHKPKQLAEASARQRRFGVVVALAVLCLTIVGVALLFILSRPRATESVAGASLDRVTLADPVPAADGRYRPPVALLVEKELVACLTKQLQRARFDPKVGAIADALRLDDAVKLARSMRAELVVFRRKRDDGKTPVAVADITGKKLEIQREIAVADAPVCQELVSSMSRIFHGEGRVTKVDGPNITVNLGWRSRVVPGMTLLVWRDKAGQPAASLTVERVEMDRCFARGQAREGDIVRVVK